MTSSDKIEINSKTLVGISVLVILFTLVIIVLNRIDSKKRYNDFLMLQETVKNSSYISQINDFTKDFLISDHETTEDIKQTLKNFNDEINRLQEVVLIYPRNEYFYYLYPWSETKAFKILRYDEQKFIDVLEDTTQDTKDLSLYKLNKKSNTILMSMIKLEHAYLKFSFNRE